MITRAFLFLLAFVSGLSAAHAAEHVVSPRAEIGSSNSLTQVAASAWMIEADKPQYYQHLIVVFPAFAVLRPALWVNAEPCSVAPRTYIGDCNRQ